jgi:transcriptional regulator with XRE-family HTH domain
MMTDLEIPGSFGNWLKERRKALDLTQDKLAQSSEAAELVSEMLQRFATLKILCTSRERLNLHGEWMYELHGLAVPPSEFTDKLEEYGAAELFLQRRI